MTLRQDKELDRHLLEIIVIRVVVLMLGLNLANRLGLLPARLGAFSFLWFFNALALTLTVVFLLWWQIDRHRKTQLFLQIGADLALTTLLVAYTSGIESSFVSFYLLIIIYCSLTLGKSGGMVGAALSTILYAGIITADKLGLVRFRVTEIDTHLATFKISAHALGFWAVAYLGTYLHLRLQVIQGELEEKINSLRRLQRLHEHIVSSIRSGLVTTDLDGRIAVFNTAARELTGRDPAEALGAPVQLFIGEKFWHRIVGADLCSQARALRHEDWLTLPNGRRRYLGFSVSPLMDESQQLRGYIVSFQDLTEISRLEEELRLKDRMAAIGRMAAAIAHEIRNPLTAMRGSVEILRTHATLPGSDERLLEILCRESDRLNDFVGDFLNYARPRKYTKKYLDVVPVLSDSVTLLRNSPEMRARHSVVLILEVPSMTIHGSAEELKQVFWNLAQNAIRAMPNGGELKIRVAQTPEGNGEIVFEDGGVGMTPEEQAQISQPFQSRFPNGIGLGLTIIFQIMEDHRGRIAFESEKGKGTRVRLSFPLETEALSITA